MRKLVKLAGIATLVVVLAAGAVGVVALAQEGSTTSSGWSLRDKMHEAIASILGVSVDKYEAAITEAKDTVLAQAVTDGWLTQEQADKLAERMDQIPPEDGMGLPFHGMRGGWDMRGSSLFSVAAEKLGLTVQELMTELQSGKSIADVAAEKGVDTQTIADAYIAQVKEQLDTAVADGRITQKQADLQLENITAQVTTQLEAACGGCVPGGFMGRGGRGRGFEGFPGGKGFGLGEL